MGYSCIQMRQLEEAEEWLNKAVEKDERLQAAHHNLVRVFLNRARAARPVPESAISHVEGRSDWPMLSRVVARCRRVVRACCERGRTFEAEGHCLPQGSCPIWSRPRDTPLESRLLVAAQAGKSSRATGHTY